MWILDAVTVYELAPPPHFQFHENQLYDFCVITVMLRDVHAKE